MYIKLRIIMTINDLIIRLKKNRVTASGTKKVVNANMPTTSVSK